MEFRTKVSVGRLPFQIEPLERMLFVGSCFATEIGQRFKEERFRAVVNPYGTMYNPASVLHTVERFLGETTDNELPRVVFITLGTNHVYILKETGEIVDNCQKRPQRLFDERCLSVEECAEYLRQSISLLRSRRQDVQVVFTVSPIRYAKYGYHESQLSKSTLLLAVDDVIKKDKATGYFPAYEIVLDELRDYRFYKSDMLHPSEQAVEYIWEQLCEHVLSDKAREFLSEWKPIKEALNHRPFNPESDEYKQFLANAQQKEKQLMEKFMPVETSATIHIIDTHTHLDGEEFNDDRDATIQRALDAGVKAMFLPAIDLASSERILSLCAQQPTMLYPMVGLHPEEVKDDWREQLSKIKSLLHKPSTLNPQPIIAIGEVGLDYYWSREFENEQLEAFEEQVKWSIETRLPLMIHCRKAQNEMVKLMRHYEKELPGGVFHCFTGNALEAQELLQFDRFVLGIGGVLTFKKSHLPEVLPQTVPLDRIVLETDSPYMAPVPMRGKRNESAYTAYVLEKLAESYGVSKEEIASRTNDNVARVFGIKI